MGGIDVKILDDEIDFCCSAMEENKDVFVHNRSDVRHDAPSAVGIHYREDEFHFHHCPFCGERIVQECEGTFEWTKELVRVDQQDTKVSE